jgi:hypothetical protein
MRFGTATVVVFAALALAGCGGGERASWEGPPRPLPADGSLPVDGFAAYLDDVDEPWERSMVGLATAYVQPMVGAAGDLHAAFPTTDLEGNGIVNVTLGRLFDDSVREVRYVLHLERRDDGSWRPIGGSWSQRCHEGRGHQAPSPAPCL